MSYYDHATMMALRLGPWADPDSERTMIEVRRRQPGTPAIRRGVERLCAVFGFRPERPVAHGPRIDRTTATRR